MNFAQPQFFVWLWLLPLLALGLWLGLRIRQGRIARFAAFRADELLTRKLSLPRSIAKLSLVLAAISLLIVALAQPRLGFEWMEVPQGGIDIMVVLDISRSMESSDIKPTRLERSKRKISDLLDMLEGDRIGIVGFAGVPFVHCPLTTDYRLAKTFISYISPDLMPVQGTAIGDAIRMATDRLTKSSKSDSEGKAILLITDGEDQDSNPIQAAEEAKAKGVKIFAIGVGGIEGAPIPIEGGGFKKDKSGNLVISKMDEETLKKIALATGGSYVRSVSGDMDLQSIYAQGMRHKVDDAEFGTSRQKIWYERFQWFLAIALAFVTAEFFLADARRRKIAATSLTLCLLVCGISGIRPALADDAKDAVQAFKGKDYDKAAKGFLNAEIEDPKQPVHPYNRGVSQFESGDYDGAAEGFSKSATAENPAVAGNSLYNLGNTLVAKGQLEQAVAAYKKALESNPKDVEAKDNMEWVVKQIEKQKQDKKDDNDQKDDKDKKDDKNQKGDKQDKKDDKQDKKDDKQDPQKSPSDDGKKDPNKPDDKDSAQDKKDGGKPDDKSDGKDKSSEQQKAEGKDKPDKDAAKDKRDISKEDAASMLESLESDNPDLLPKPQITKPAHESDKDW